MPPRVGWLCHSPLLTAATSPVFGSVLTPRWWFTLHRWLWPSPDPSSAPSRSRASWHLQEPLKLEQALVAPVLLGPHVFMVVPDGDWDTQLEAVDHAKCSESCYWEGNVQEMIRRMQLCGWAPGCSIQKCCAFEAVIKCTCRCSDHPKNPFTFFSCYFSWLFFFLVPFYLSVWLLVLWIILLIPWVFVGIIMAMSRDLVRHPF